MFQTSEGHLILYNVEAHSEHTAYQQYDPPTASLRRDSAELFVKEVIPSLKITQVIHQELKFSLFLFLITNGFNSVTFCVPLVSAKAEGSQSKVSIYWTCILVILLVTMRTAIWDKLFPVCR